MMRIFKKAFSFFFCMFVILSQLTSCIATKYKFMNDTSEISSIEFVECGYNWEEDDYYENKLAEVTEVEEFISDLSKIKYHSIVGIVAGFSDSLVGIKIIYSNGEYEIISEIARRAVYKPDLGCNYNAGMGRFDKTEYQNLLSKYFLPCENTSFYLMHDSDKISSIEIVDTYRETNTESRDYVQIPLAEVENTADFLCKLYEIEYKYTLQMGVPNGKYTKEERRNAIKINYINGDYEVIDHEWRDLYVSELDEYISNAYIGEFDKDSFDALLNEVLLPK